MPEPNEEKVFLRLGIPNFRVFAWPISWRFLVLGSVIFPLDHIERATLYGLPNLDRRAGKIETTDRMNASRKS
jgi:hypothetical protein